MPWDCFRSAQILSESWRFTASLKPPMLRTSTNAASPSFADMRMDAELMTTMTYCSGFPMVSATILESVPSSACRFSSEIATVVSILSKGILSSVQLRPIYFLAEPAMPRNLWYDLHGGSRIAGESQRDSATKPRVARDELPWVKV